MVLRLTGCDLVLVGKHPEKMKLFTDMQGSTITLDAFCADDDRFDVVVEASGHPSGWELVVNRVKPRGTIVSQEHVPWEPEFQSCPSGH